MKSHDYYKSEWLLSMDYIPVECAALRLVVFSINSSFIHSLLLFMTQFLTAFLIVFIYLVEIIAVLNLKTEYNSTL